MSAMSSRAEVFRLLEAVVAGGVRHFDTARSYGKGFSEKLLGEFFRASGDAVAVTTKCGVSYLKTNACPTFIALPLNRMVRRIKDIGYGISDMGSVAGSGSLVAGKSPSSISDLPSAKAPQITRNVIERSMEESLKQLGRGRVEILLMHEAVPSELTDGAREYLAELRKQGVVGRLGCGTNRWVLEERFQEDPLVEVLQYEGSVTERLPLMERFPGKMHIHHSLFRERGAGRPGEVLRRALERNPNGKVIFSTRSREHLRENLEELG